MIRQMNLEEVGLKIENPKRYSPMMIIYDVEKELKKEELKDELINKNFMDITEKEGCDMKEKVEFKYSFKTKDDRVN